MNQARFRPSLVHRKEDVIYSLCINDLNYLIFLYGGSSSKDKNFSIRSELMLFYLSNVKDMDQSSIVIGIDSYKPKGSKEFFFFL